MCVSVVWILLTVKSYINNNKNNFLLAELVNAGFLFCWIKLNICLRCSHCTRSVCWRDARFTETKGQLKDNEMYNSGNRLHVLPWERTSTFRHWRTPPWISSSAVSVPFVQGHLDEGRTIWILSWPQLWVIVHDQCSPVSGRPSILWAISG